ncbi:S1 RNA-binding domain-containing protein [Terrilactibacillus sp. BCM23-1]|uniref:S1 RNA-binding domain-containing protein n=1 Tax=Terrilactibacillus tamarindi TaxID=2599694 RepID=A0A6N8CVQ0_9BACI|nr:ribonuclease E/G [Terrilactibacillus tamarindi]MTT32416.1 S1 RNA-binding domain-containing protein [Terrilactibacillus tamarindi]
METHTYTIVVENTKEFEKWTVLIDDNVQTFYLKPKDATDHIGDILLGQVTNMVKGLQGVFIELGSPQKGFIHQKDLLYDVKMNPLQQGNIQKGQKMIVQVEKEAVRSKGPRLTQHIQIRGEHLIYLPYSHYIAVSHQLSIDQGEKLKSFLQDQCHAPEGVIIRTSAANIEKSDLICELETLKQRWIELTKTIDMDRLGAIHKKENQLLQDIISEHHISGIINLYTDHPQKISEAILPKVTIISRGKVGLEQRRIIDRAYATAINRKLVLHSGAVCIFDYTEALTIIDINSAGVSPKRNWEETAYAINLEAATEIVNQIKLRQIGGMILIDFIRLTNEDHKKKLLQYVKSCFQNDFMTTKVLGYSNLGLMELTRKKKRYGIQDAVIEKKH